MRERRGRLLVPELRGHEGDRRAGLEQLGRERMAQVVEPEVREPRLAQKRTELLGGADRIEQGAGSGREEKRRRLAAGHESVLLARGLPVVQRRRQAWVTSTSRVSFVFVFFRVPRATAC